MKNTMYYTVSCKFWNPITDENPRIYNEVEQEWYVKMTKCKDNVIFDEDVPIESRKKAFSHFHHLVCVMLEIFNCKYVTDRDARLDLQRIMQSGKWHNDWLNGIKITAVLDSPIGEIINQRDIYSIDYQDEISIDNEENILGMLEGLKKEAEWYRENQFDCGDDMTTLNTTAIGGGIEHILSTPFDWENFITQNKGKNFYEDMDRLEKALDELYL